MHITFIYMVASHFVLPNTRFERLMPIYPHPKNHRMPKALVVLQHLAYCIHLQGPCHNQRYMPHLRKDWNHHS